MALVINFSDFRRLALDNNRRIYYYQNDEILEVCFISEGMLVKSFKDLSKVESLERFYDDELFIGATRLVFKIPDGDFGSRSIRDVIPKPDVIKEMTPVEADGGEDIQREGVGE